MINACIIYIKLENQPKVLKEQMIDSVKIGLIKISRIFLQFIIITKMHVA